MPIRQDENQPNRRFGIINLVLIGFGALLLFSSFFPSQNTQVPRVPYSPPAEGRPRPKVTIMARAYMLQTNWEHLLPK